MATLGSPKTTKFVIGTFELRVGPMFRAGLLSPDHSVGLIDNVKLDVAMDSVDLMGGFPQQPVDTALTSNVTSLTASLREYSRRNMDILLGNGVNDYAFADKDRWVQVVNGAGGSGLSSGQRTFRYRTPGTAWAGYWDAADAELVDPTYNADNISGQDQPAPPTGSIAAPVLTDSVGAANDAALAAAPAPFRVGDVITIHCMTDPTRVHISTISAITGTTFTVATGQGLPVLNGSDSGVFFAPGEKIIAYRARTVAGGAAQKARYFAVQLLRLDRRTGRPTGFNFWKATVNNGASISAETSQFSSTDLGLKFLQPATIEYSVPSSPLYLQRNVIPKNPVYQLFDTSDFAVDYTGLV